MHCYIPQCQPVAACTDELLTLQLRVHTTHAEGNKLSLEAGARAACISADGAGHMGLKAQGCTAQKLPMRQA